MKPQRWNFAGLELREVLNGIEVSQHEEKYLARDWRLSQDLIFFVATCIAEGAICAIRHSHPQPSNRVRGVDYIGFSRAPEERIICVADQHGPKTKSADARLKRIIFENHYRFALDKARVNWKWQGTSAKNIEVPFAEFPLALKSCLESTEFVEQGIGARKWEAAKARFGVVTESVLEDWMIRHWNQFKFGLPLQFVGNQICRSDILARYETAKTTKYVIFELKKKPAQFSVFKQFDCYVNGRLRQKVIGLNVPIMCAIVAQSFDENIVREAKKQEFPIALFSFPEKLTKPDLKCVFTNWSEP